MRRLATLIAVVGLVVVFGVVTTTPAIAKPKRKFGRLKAPKDGIWLIHHYDNRTGDFSGAPVFEDSGETKFRGRIGGIGKATVEQSAAWTWTTWDPEHPCAAVYAPYNVYDPGSPFPPKILVRIHTHQGVTTDPGGTVIGRKSPAPEPHFPIDITGIGTHPFTGIIKITKKSGATINGAILGGYNCEVKIIPGSIHGAPWDFSHTDTHNTVTTVFKITDGTKRFSGVKGDGVLSFTYDTFEPHTLLDAHITIFKFK